jgi:hypothetical protein
MAHRIIRRPSLVHGVLNFVRICFRLDMTAGIVMAVALFTYLTLHSL